ncbi:MAG: N-dimethylarginine dimethylaminohydrolase [Mycobacterium sp.]|nr:N-dimethylarginine dimethylaminohydrolase [Mycobacterium sp.]
MTVSPDLAPGNARTRSPRPRRYVMTRPTFFGVEYAINPWMDVNTEVDVDNAIAQWETLGDTYRKLGHTVEVVDPVAGLPDMVYAANAGLIVNGTAIVARFKHAEREGEATAYAEWLTRQGYAPVTTRHINEGQGDFLVAGELILAGTGFRTAPQAHAEVAAITGMRVVTLELVDPRFYHLDTALTVLDDTTVAYYPQAFTDSARARLLEIFPEVIEVSSADAYVLGLNAVSDGGNVVLPQSAVGFAEQLYHAGFQPIGVDLSELLKGGGSIKCCTLEIYS